MNFQFDRDTFAFANELVWEYRLDPKTGRMVTCRSDPPPTHSHRCFVMVRSARQFFYHARYDSTQPPADEPTCRRLVRQVVARTPRRPSAEEARITFPGYESLRALSRAQAPLLKAECGSAWESYFLRSHWRMVFPVWPGHQEQMARKLAQAVRDGVVPLVHLFRFPHITINHGMVLYGANESEQAIQFEAYDPNIPDHPVSLFYQRAARAFHFPATHYWAGGKVSVIEIYRGWCY